MKIRQFVSIHKITCILIKHTCGFSYSCLMYIHTHTQKKHPHNLEVSLHKSKFLSTMKLGADELPNDEILMHA
jgi:hypothetical protein